MKTILQASAEETSSHYAPSTIAAGVKTKVTKDLKTTTDPKTGVARAETTTTNILPNTSNPGTTIINKERTLLSKIGLGEVATPKSLVREVGEVAMAGTRDQVGIKGFSSRIQEGTVATAEAGLKMRQWAKWIKVMEGIALGSLLMVREVATREAVACNQTRVDHRIMRKAIDRLPPTKDLEVVAAAEMIFTQTVSTQTVK